MRTAIYIDTETTGFSSDDRICELMLACTKNWEVVDSYHAFYNPGRPVPPAASKVNGLVWERDLIDKPAFDPRALIPFLTSGLPIVAYNANFDRRMIEAEFRRAMVPFPQCEWIDACKTARITIPGLANYKLATVAEHFQLDTTNMHRADKDVHVLIEMCRHMEEEQISVVEKNHNIINFDPSHLDPYEVKLRQYLEMSRKIKLATTPSDLSQIDDVSNTFQSLNNALDKRRKMIVEGPTREIRKINAAFKRVRDAIKAEKERLDEVYVAYLSDSDAATTYKSDRGSSSAEQVWELDDSNLDLSQVDPAYLKLDEAKIKKYLADADGQPEITGLSFKRGWKISRRAK